MTKSSFYILLWLTFYTTSCCDKHSKLQRDIKGTWINKDQKANTVVTFYDSTYTSILSQDDVVISTKGKYFINENKFRKSKTVTLIPDIAISDKDTIILPCDNLDIIEYNDSTLFIQKPTKWHKSLNGKSNIINEVACFAKTN
jgi:hypothetical protein